MTSRSATTTERRRAASSPPASAARPRAPRAPAGQRRRAARTRRRRGLALGLLAVLALAGALVAGGAFRGAVKEITLPLRHEDVIRQQAAAKGLDPSLIAAVIYTESHFRDGQTSEAGAEGLMQLTPATAKDIARKSGGSAFELADLATPQVNISYGAYYLRYLLRRYDGDETLALAAYNGGEGNVDRWRAAAARRGERFDRTDIPFAETRAYVDRVEAARRSYRSEYAVELGT